MRVLAAGLWNVRGSATFTVTMHFVPRPVIRILVVAVLCFYGIGNAQARFPQYLKNVGLVYGPAFHSPLQLTGQAWELSYDRIWRTCIRRRPYWGVGLGTERSGGDGASSVTARFSFSPYRLMISRRISALTLLSMRVGRWTGDGATSDFIRPEIGFQLMTYNTVFSPKLIVQYGRDVRLRSSLEGNVHPVPGGVFTMQAGVTVNIGSLARRWRKPVVVAPTTG